MNVILRDSGRSLFLEAIFAPTFYSIISPPFPSSLLSSPTQARHHAHHLHLLGPAETQGTRLPWRLGFETLRQARPGFLGSRHVRVKKPGETGRKFIWERYESCSARHVSCRQQRGRKRSVQGVTCHHPGTVLIQGTLVVKSDPDPPASFSGGKKDFHILKKVFISWCSQNSCQKSLHDDDRM